MHGGTGIASGMRLRRRLQTGSLIKKHGSWHVRYRDWKREPDGALSWQQVSTRLGSCKEFPRRGDILETCQDFIAQINSVNLDSGLNDPHLRTFIEHIYFSSPAFTTLALSTQRGYRDMWRLHLRSALARETLSSLRTVTIGKILQDLATEKDLSKLTLSHIKSFIGGIYTFARNAGYFDGANPATGVKLPKAKSPGETYASLA